MSRLSNCSSSSLFLSSFDHSSSIAYFLNLNFYSLWSSYYSLYSLDVACLLSCWCFSFILFTFKPKSIFFCSSLLYTFKFEAFKLLASSICFLSASMSWVSDMMSMFKNIFKISEVFYLSSLRSCICFMRLTSSI